jgi:hypothetical protein
LAVSAGPDVIDCMMIPKTLCSLALAASLSKSASFPYEILDTAREISLAKSAGIPPWNEDATIYVLGPQGYSKAKEGRNGFSCMVGRSDPGTRWPICFDAIGSETILPRYIREAELRIQGRTAEEVRQDTARKFLSGEYRAPSRAGISYMLSKETIASNGKELILVPPHLMFYAPNVRSEEIGAVRGHVHSPMAQFEGDPHGYIIVFVRDTPVELTSLGPIPK